MRERAWHRSVLAAGLAALLAPLVLGLGSCSDDSADGGPSTTERRQSTSTSSSSTSTTTTQPESSDDAGVRPILNELLGHWDEAMTGVAGDPEAAVDPQSDLREPFAEVFTADSPFVADLTDFVSQGYVGQDLGTRPATGTLNQHTVATRLTGTPDDDHLSFVFCSFNDGEDFYLSTGERRSADVGITEGAGEAVRVDGVWKLHRLQQLTFNTAPEGSPNPCPGRVAPPAEVER